MATSTATRSSPDHNVTHGNSMAHAMARAMTIGKDRRRRVWWAWAAIFGLAVVITMLLTGCQVPLRN